MKGYEKGRLPYVIFGTGVSLRTGAELKKRDIKKCLVISGRHVIRHPVTIRVLQSIQEQVIQTDVYADVPAEPPDSVVMGLAKKIKNEGYDCVLGIGGGSPMDAAKAASLIAGIPKEIRDLHAYGKSGDKMRECWKRPCMLVLMPTTSGTGAEATGSAVLTSTQHGVKFSFGNQNITADLCLIDPEFTKGLPALPTVYGGLDALAHTVEILVGTGANEYTSAILLKCLEKIWNWLPKAVANPDNMEAREQLSWAAHNSLANGGIPNGHAVAHAIGALYHITHAHACAMVLPTVIRHFAKESPEAIRKIAAIVGVDASQDAEAVAELAAEKIAAFYQSFGLKPLSETIQDMGCTDDEETFLKKMVPVVMDDFKYREWLPPIHTGNSSTKVSEVCRMIYRDSGKSDTGHVENWRKENERYQGFIEWCD